MYSIHFCCFNEMKVKIRTKIGLVHVETGKQINNLK